MKAWVWRGAGRLELVADYPDPAARPGWVVLKTRAAGICSTDVAIIDGRFSAGDPPAVLGHEICGEVVELGSGSTAVGLGERVVVETSVACGFCQKCRSGNKHLCRDAGEIGFPPFDGGYAEYVAVPQGCVRRMPAEMTDGQGAVLEAALCPFGRIYRHGLKPGAKVLVTGAGVAGLSFVQSARCQGASKVIVAARNRHRLDEALRFGADVAVDVGREDLCTRVLQETGGEGVDLAVDTAGVSATIAAAIRCCAKGGRVELYGIPADTDRVELPAKDLIFRQISVSGGTNNELAWVPLMELIASGRFNIAGMLTHTFGFDDLDKAVDLGRRKPEGLIKACVTVGGDAGGPSRNG